MNKELTIDKEKALIYMQELITLFREIDSEEALTVLNAFTCAMVHVAAEVKENAHSETNDATERLILTWIMNMDKASGLNFEEYVKTCKI